MPFGNMFAAAAAKNSLNENWKNTCEAFSKWKSGDGAVEQKKAREEYETEKEERLSARNERKSKISDKWAANKAKTTSN